MKQQLKWFIMIVVVTATLLPASCSNDNTSRTDTTKPSVTPVIPDVPLVSTNVQQVADAIQGNWEVGQAAPGIQITDLPFSSGQHLGTLNIRGNSYSFQPISDTLRTADINPTLQFLFETPQGEIVLEYQPNVHPDDFIDSFDPSTFLAMCMFRSESTEVGRFFIVVDGPHLYFHSFVSEISLWSISKSIN